MTQLLLHNLISGWRNFIKYKTQNIISILCLSVGTFVFSLTLWLLICGNNEKKTFCNNDKITFSISYRNDLGQYFTKNEINTINTIKSFHFVKLVLAKEGIYEDSVRIKDKSGKTYKISSIYYVNYDWLKHYKPTSAITGKTIDIKNNESKLLIAQQTKNRFYEDEEDLIGLLATTNKISHTIDDVIDISFCPFLGNSVYYVCNTEEHSKIYSQFHNITAILNEGYTKDDFSKEIQKAFPDCKLEIFHDYNQKKRTNQQYAVMFLLCLGVSILVIGLTGYLKMQIQLFKYRTREMAIRRCNGAKAKDLFSLLVAELFFVFLGLAIMSIPTTIAYTNSINSIYNMINNSRLINFGVMYKLNTWIVLFAFIISIIIAFVSVYRALNKPLDKTVGKSVSHTSKIGYVMQIVQYCITCFVIFIISIFSIVTMVTTQNHNYDIDIYKSIGKFSSNDLAHHYDHIKNMKSVKETGLLYNSYIYLLEPIDSNLIVGKCEYNDKIREYCYNRVIITPSVLNMMKIQIQDKDSKSNNINCHVYVHTSDIKQIQKELGIKNIPTTIYKLDNENEYIRLGYIATIDIFGNKTSVNSYNLIPNAKIKDMINEGNNSIVITTKNEDFSKLNDELYDYILKTADKKQIDTNNLNKKVVRPLYEEYFGFEIIKKNLYRFLGYLIIVCFVSIIITLYSSVTLDTRSRQKEIAIRKINGAKTLNILFMLYKKYIYMIVASVLITSCISTLIIISLGIEGDITSRDDIIAVLFVFYGIPLFNFLILSLITFLTIWNKIYKVAKMNPAEIIKKE